MVQARDSRSEQGLYKEAMPLSIQILEFKRGLSTSIPTHWLKCLISPELGGKMGATEIASRLPYRSPSNRVRYLVRRIKG